MGHPNLNFAGKPLEKIAFSGDFQHGLAIFAGPAASDLSSEGMDHQLKSVADAENGNSQLEDGRIAFGGVFGIDARGTAGKDDPARILLADLRRRRGVGHDFTVDVALPDTPGDQLAVLRPEVQYNNGFTHMLLLVKG